MIVENRYNIGQIVYLKTCPEQKEYMVTGLTIRPHGIVYILNYGIQESDHFEIELSAEQNPLKKLEA